MCTRYIVAQSNQVLELQTAKGMITRPRYVPEDMSGKYSNTIRVENVCRPNAREVYARPKLTAKWIPGGGGIATSWTWLMPRNTHTHTADRGTSHSLWIQQIKVPLRYPSFCDPPRARARGALASSFINVSSLSYATSSYIHLFDTCVTFEISLSHTVCARYRNTHIDLK